MGTQRQNGSLYTRTSGYVATVEFGHPAGNSMNSELLDRLSAALEKLSADDNVSVVVLRSEGERAFCGGASFDELSALQHREEAGKFFGGFAKLINAIRRCRKPVIARVQGKAVGGGVGLIAACDYAMATDAAAVKLSEISIGIAPLVIAPAVERKIGKAGLAELALDPSSWKNAYWAKEKGLYAEVFDSAKLLDKEIEHLSTKLASYSQQALVAMKRVLWEGTENWDVLLEQRAQLSGELALSDTAKAILENIKSGKS